MKTFILPALLFIIQFATEIFSQNKPLLDIEAVKTTIRLEIKLHPKASLPDLYKNFFQGKFGPGHLIENRKAAQEYLEYELSEAEEFDSVLIQPVGYEENFFRVNLALIKEGKLETEKLLDAFITSADLAGKPEIAEWEAEWNSIVKIIKEMNLNLPNFEKEKEKIAKNLKEGKVIGHHSKAYTENYHPHYRLIHKTLMEELPDKLEVK